MQELAVELLRKSPTQRFWVIVFSDKGPVEPTNGFNLKGHAWVGLIDSDPGQLRRNDPNDLTAREKSVLIARGFSPIDEGTTNSKGQLSQDGGRPFVVARAYPITASDYFAILQKFDEDIELNPLPDYHLGGRDCVDWAVSTASTAKTVNLKVQQSTRLPSFITGLGEEDNRRSAAAISYPYALSFALIKDDRNGSVLFDKSE